MRRAADYRTGPSIAAAYPSLDSAGGEASEQLFISLAFENPKQYYPPRFWEMGKIGNLARSLK